MAKFDKNDKKEMLKVRKAVLRKFPALATTMSTLKYKSTRRVDTAATDAETVYYNPDFMGKLKTFDEKVFVMAHETMHVSLNHIYRAMRKQDRDAWNQATDAVINQTLLDEGLPMPQVEGIQFIQMPEAKDKSAEQMYKQIRANKRKRQQQGQGNQNQQQGQQGQNQQSSQGQGEGQSQHQDSQPQQSNGGGGQGDSQSQQQPSQSQPQNQDGGSGTDSQPQQDQPSQGSGSGSEGKQQEENKSQGGEKSQQEDKRQEKDKNTGGGEGQSEKEKFDEKEFNGHSDHEMWNKAIDKAKKKDKKNQKDKNKSEDKKQEKKEEKQEDKKDQPKQEKQKDKKQDPQKNNLQQNNDKKPSEQKEDNKTKQQNKPNNGTPEGEKVKEDDFSQEEDSFEGKKPEKPDEKPLEKEPDDEEGSEDDIKEKEFRQLNRKLRKELAEQMREAIQRKADAAKDTSFGRGAGSEKGKFGQVGTAKAAVSWKTLLRREFDKDQPEWSYRRASADNHYMARIENRIMFEHPMTEVMLDTSGSIDDVLLRGFLRQLKPLLKSSKLRVSCFDDEVYGFVDIKSNEDIDDFTFYGRGGTNLDLPVRAFSKDKKINKIVFTDGCGVMPRQDLKDVNVLWLIFDNNDFKPCCGKVIYVNKQEVIKEEDDYENEMEE